MLAHFGDDRPGLCRGSKSYSSLPNKLANESESNNNGNTLPLKKAHGASRRNKSECQKQQSAEVVPQVMNLNLHTEEPCEVASGLSNNLSTESLKNACDFVDDDFCTHNLPRQRSLQNLLSAPRERTDTEIPLPNVNLMEDSEQNDALNVLNELDAILDIHDVSLLHVSCAAGENEIETNIEDCLLDLDKYLEFVDNSFETYSEAEQDNSKASEPDLAKPDQQEECRLHSTNRMRRQVSLDDVIKNEHSEPNAEESYRYNTSTFPSRKRNVNKMTCGSFHKSLNGSASRIFPVNDVGVTNVDEKTAADAVQYCFGNILEVTLPPTNSEEAPEHCSPNDYINNVSSIRPNEMLNQDNIFNNLLQQSERNRADDRPRQFGRRAENDFHPTLLRSETPDDQSASTTANENEPRPFSAPAIVTRCSTENASFREGRFLSNTESEQSSVRSSSNPSPISTASSIDSTSTVPSMHEHGHTNIVETLNLQPRNMALLHENSMAPCGSNLNNVWPYSCSRTLALISCALGLFNICRIAVLTIHYGANFLLQFLLLSLLFGIPLFWLQMCLGSKIKSGPVSMWKISPVCKGIGIALVLIQCLIAIYSTAVVGWVLVYLRDSLHNKSQIPHHWRELAYVETTSNATTSYLTEYVATYFNINVLQRLKLTRTGTKSNSDTNFRVSDELVFNLTLLWTLVFVVLCRGLKSFGLAIWGLTVVPLLLLIIVTTKLCFAVDSKNLQHIFASTDLSNFLINSHTWCAAEQETFLTWGLLGSSVIAITSRMHANASEYTLRRDAFLVVIVTFIGILGAAFLGLLCMEILRQNDYVYIPGSFEQASSYTSVFSLKDPVKNHLLLFPVQWMPHYSSYSGEIYRRPTVVTYEESGYQTLRFITEIFPAATALCRNSFSAVWVALAYTMFALFGLAQLCVMWKPISFVLGSSTNSVLISCVTGLLLSIPFATEIGIYAVHFMDILLGGAWFIPILWTAQIFGVFLIRGRPYNGDDLVNDLKLPSSLSAFLAFSWNLLIPIGLITLSVASYNISFSNQFFHWQGKSYFTPLLRKIGGLTQIAFLLLVPLTAFIQIYRYLSSGPPDIFDRVQLLYRPLEDARNNRGVNLNTNREESTTNRRLQPENLHLSIHPTGDDAPPKYTPPPSYTTATGAQLAKFLRQSLRRSVRRMFRESGRLRSAFSADTETQQTLTQYPSGMSDFSRNTTSSNQTVATANADISRSATTTLTQRSLSLGRKVLSQKERGRNYTQRSPSFSLSSEPHSRAHRPFSAEDVVSILRPTATRRPDAVVGSNYTNQELNSFNARTESSFCSVENLILNEGPMGESPAAILSGDDPDLDSN